MFVGMRRIYYFWLRRSYSRLEMKSKNLGFCFAFRSLIRNFGFAEFTSVRKSKSKKILFSFAFRSLIRNFATTNTNALWQKFF